MIYIRPQKTYKPAKSSSSRPNNNLEEIRNSLDHFKLTIEAAHGFTISKDTPQLPFSVHIFNAKDGSEVTAALAERGFKPTWQLGGKLLPEACITESGYTATLSSNEVNAFYAELTVTIRERDLLLILADPSMQHIVGMILDGGEFPSATISVSERILNRTLMDSIRQAELTVIDDKLRNIDTSLTAKADKTDLAAVKTALDSKVSTTDFTNEKKRVNTALGKKADTTALTDGLAAKLDTNQYTTDKAAQDEKIDTAKRVADNAYQLVGDKADKTELDKYAKLTALAEYAKQTELATAKQEVNSALVGKADKETLHEMYRDLSRADSVLETSLHKKADKTDLLSIEERKKLADLSSSFNSLRTADQKRLQGLSLNNFIELSNAAGQVTAYISGGGSKDAVLMAGITNYGTARQRDKVAIYPNGVGHFGNLYFGGDRIDFKEQENDDPKLSILMKDAEFIERLLRKSRYDHTENSPEEEITLDKDRKQFSFSITVPNDDTRLDIAIGHILCEVYSETDDSQPSRELRVLLDQEVLGRWRGSISYSMTPNPFGGGFTHETNYNPTEVNNLRYTRYVSSGTHTLSIVIYTAQNVDIGRDTQALIKDVSMRGFYDAGIQQSLISKSGVRFFGSADRYLDVDYRFLPSGGGVNPFLLRVKGSARIDYLTLENPIDAPGCVLAGGSVTWGGTINNSFGKYKNERGTQAPNAYYNSSRKVFVVNHSISNTKYVPMITSTAGSWADLPQVVAVNAYSFEVAFINGNNERNQWSFNYTCFKAD